MNHLDVNYFDTLDKELKDVLVKYLEHYSLLSLVLILVDIYKSKDPYLDSDDYYTYILNEFLQEN